MKQREPQIIIIGEAHPANLLNIVRSYFYLLAFAKNVGASDEEIKPLLESVNSLLDSCNLICVRNIRWLRKYGDAEVLVEKMTMGGEYTKMPADELEKLSLICETYFGKEYVKKINQAVFYADEYLELHSKAKTLEFRLLAKASDSLGNKLKFILRDAPTMVRLARTAKRIAKSGGRVLIICGTAHARRYASFLKGLGYDIELLTSAEEKIQQTMVDTGLKIFELCNEKGISERTMHGVFKFFGL